MKKITAHSQFNEKNELNIDWKVSGLDPINYKDPDLVVHGYIFNAKELSDFILSVLYLTKLEDLDIEKRCLIESIRKDIDDRNPKYSMSTETK